METLNETMKCKDEILTANTKFLSDRCSNQHQHNDNGNRVINTLLKQTTPVHSEY